MKILVVSCDKYEACWKPFFKLLDKYYSSHPKCYLLTEKKKCPYCYTINVDSNIWTKRLRVALERIEDDEVMILLDDFFIRRKVDEERINNIKLNENIACYNFELEYREPLMKLKGWDIQKNQQIYLNSCQPSIWNKKVLIERLDKDLTPQEWEEAVVDSPYLHFINNGDYIIDIGYRHQLLEKGGFGICRGKLSKECLEFLEKEGLADEIVKYFDTHI